MAYATVVVAGDLPFEGRYVARLYAAIWPKDNTCSISWHSLRSLTKKSRRTRWFKPLRRTTTSLYNATILHNYCPNPLVRAPTCCLSLVPRVGGDERKAGERQGRHVHV